MQISVAEMNLAIQQLDLIETRVRKTRQRLEGKLRTHLDKEAVARHEA